MVLTNKKIEAGCKTDRSFKKREKSILEMLISRAFLMWNFVLISFI